MFAANVLPNKQKVLDGTQNAFVLCRRAKQLPVAVSLIAEAAARPEHPGKAGQNAEIETYFTFFSSQP